MRCLSCSFPETRVLDSRETLDAVRRRRECMSCKRRFTTYERVRIEELRVVKRDGRKEAFERGKLERGIRLAFAKRPIGETQIVELTDGIEETVRGWGLDEVPTNRIGELVMQRLRPIDEVAYVRFASVHKEFQDAKHFVQEVQASLSGR
ncbi:MAG: transcriptional regulator NrdR [Methanobacteriota archaeon]